MATPVLPQIIVEVALVAGQPVSGPGTMTLNDASFGLLDTDFLATADTWTDVTAYVLGFTTTRPSSRVQGPLLQFEAGTASIMLDNSDGRFDPDNLSGPYVSGGVSQVHAMVPVRISAVWGNVRYPIFRGFADSWQESAVSFAGPESIWTLSATDGFKILAGITLPAVAAVGAGELTGARINRLLNAANWYTGQGGGARIIAAGDSPLQATTFNGVVLDLIRLASDSELGQVYIDGSGAVVFRNRRALINESRSVNSQATFGDNPAGAELPCATIGRADDDTTIGNDIQATRVGGTQQEVTDAASIAMYLFPRTYSRSDLIVTGDVDALNWAGWVLYIAKSGEDRFDSITVDPQYQPTDLWPQVLGRDMGDRITGVRRPPNVTAVTRDGFISGVSHTFDATNSTWLTTWTLQDASKYGSFFTLDNAVTGRLNDNALTF
jgi:hypothetical protein